MLILSRSAVSQSITVLLVIASLLYLLIMASEMLSCAQKLWTINSNASRSLSLNQFITPPNYQSMIGPSANFFIVMVLSGIIGLMVWHLKVTVGILMVTGGLFGTVLLALYPILLFNKAYGRFKKDYQVIRAVNWGLFLSVVASGAYGSYQGLKLVNL